MAQESCNLDKEEAAELLKPPSPPHPPPPSSPPHPPPPSSTPHPPPPSSPSHPLTPSLSPPPPPSHSPTLFPNHPRAITPGKAKVLTSKQAVESQPSIRPVSRCSCCQKRVGLVGFRCRCGELFCSRHRYSETHDCSFDYKAAGREEISKANPVVRAAKIIKI